MQSSSASVYRKTVSVGERRTQGAAERLAFFYNNFPEQRRSGPSAGACGSTSFLSPGGVDVKFTGQLIVTYPDGTPAYA